MNKKWYRILVITAFLLSLYGGISAESVYPSKNCYIFDDMLVCDTW